MQPGTLGARLPSPYYEWTRDENRRVIHHRKCQDCGYEYPTAEIPLAQNWEGQQANCCPVHTDTVGKVMGSISVPTARTGRYRSPGLTSAYQMGAQWRRRQCKVDGCMAKGKPGKPTRWTTVELSIDGLYTEDITMCGRCRGRTKLRRH